MSSRTAAGRRRVMGGEESRPSLSSKGLFFKNKSPKLPTESYPSPPLQNSNLPPTNIPDVSSYLQAAQQSHHDTNIRPESQQPPTVQGQIRVSYGRVSDDVFRSTSVSAHSASVYQEQPDFEHRGSYIEASYQPPPPQQLNRAKIPEVIHVQGLDLAFPPPPTFPPPSSPSRITPFLLRSPNRALQTLPSNSATPQQHFPLDHTSYANSPIPYATPQPRPDLHLMTDLSPYLSPSHQYREISVYPSPPLTHARLTPSPLRALESPTPDLRWGQNAHENPSSHSVASTGPPRFQNRSQRGPLDSAHSNSSGSSVHSVHVGRSSVDSGSTVSTFVFPGSRSTARPKVSKQNGGTQGKVSKRNKTRANNPSPLPEAAHAMPPSFSVHSADMSTDFSTTTGDSTFSSSESEATGSHSGGSLSSGAISVMKSNSGSSNSAKSDPPVFVFPSSRSRAQPAKALKSIEKKQKRELSGKSDNAGGNDEKKTKFLGLLKKKSKPPILSIAAITPESSDPSSSSLSASPSFNGSFTHAHSPTPSDHQQQYHETQAAIHMESRERAKRMKSRIGSYPLDPYDPVLLDNDRHTGELLARLNPTGSPTFHNYGNNPPTSVLDLGCGQGHWVIDAAMAWKGYGTTVTGYDMVDISEGLLPWAAEQDVIDSIRFVKGNFLKQRLPFSDDSFDLIRMSCLALCITTDSWVFVLQEVSRVLMVGGRLELIDDEIFFPYGIPNSLVDPISGSSTSPPRLDITIPSPLFTTFSVYDSETTNPGLRSPNDIPESEDDVYGLYGVEEEGEIDDTATVHDHAGYNAPQLLATPQLGPPSQPPSQNGSLYGTRPTSLVGLSWQAWSRAQATSQDLESLFDHMLMHHFGINKNPTDAVLELMQQVFGHAREVRTMRLSLAPPSENAGRLSPSDPMFTFGRRHAPSSIAVIRSPGLVLEPSTFIPMDPWEIEIHASKHYRMLLSCKSLLAEHAIEATGDEEIDEESVQYALCEYEGFLKHRLNPPPVEELDDSIEGDSDNFNYRHSFAGSVSSDNQEEMWEIQNEFMQRFAWSGNGSRDRSSTPLTPMSEEDVLGLRATAPRSSTTSPPFLDSPTSTIMKRVLPSGLPIPAYQPSSRMPHIRTFRVYEAVKLDDGMLSNSNIL